MPKIKLELGAELDVLSGDELKKGLGDNQTSWFREMARGLKIVRWSSTRAVSAGVLNLGGDVPDQTLIGPREGFVWMVERISVKGDSINDTIAVYRGNNQQDANFVANVPLTSGYFSPGHRALLLHPGEVLAFSGTALNSTRITVNGEAIECPGPMIWKLVG